MLQVFLIFIIRLRYAFEDVTYVTKIKELLITPSLPQIKPDYFSLSIKCLGNIFISFQLYWSLLHVTGGTDVFLGQEQDQLLNLKNTDING